MSADILIDKDTSQIVAIDMVLFEVLSCPPLDDLDDLDDDDLDDDALEEGCLDV